MNNLSIKISKNCAYLKGFYSEYAFPINSFLIWRAIILFFQIFVQPKFGINSRATTLYDRLYLSWNTYWDAGHYISIADNGYDYPLQNFFPLWPMLIKFLTFIIRDSYATSYILTLLLGLLTCILIYRLGRHLLSSEQNKIALILFLAYPGTMFLHAGYTETPFLVLTLLMFVLIEQKKYFSAALIGGWTSATRLVGIIMPLIFLVLNIPFKKKLVLMAITLIGILSYCTYLYISTDNPLYFKEAQKHWCALNKNCTLTSPVTTLLNAYDKLPSLSHATQYGIDYVTLNWIFSALFLIVSLLLFKKLPLHIALYSLLTVAFPLATGSTISMMRYALLAFPVFYGVSLIIKNKYILTILIIVCALLQLQSIADFTKFDWVGLIHTLHA